MRHEARLGSVLISSTFPTSHSVTHPSSVSALRADPPSPTTGEGEGSATPPDPPSRWNALCR
ncbi:hypothetical protein EN817_12355 [Mesorhizobium sp. M3A.F.Ca.ET.174.01.1.1]|nr:MAG: hypothetical protein EOQ49_20795 [Mesorhizobium sp.]TGS69145.1 hypothetical protein EN844_09765 [Mesorhizobium sp. M3A.F.Ca.ET.201.01.1.1]TGS87013.1 hypothetical protein EN818_12355 [Mesorhizobium sp. M3A.F.Ca.ET.175.01.1.1]TGT26844.1 hypothetical protein EN817_12355 [Mesorhizobium sp. M3A.F.Ca.ET.174.01.1.1]RWB91861.1 MAG: hypothetical protein EOQ52_05835 [Mesorhizobium sp.]